MLYKYLLLFMGEVNWSSLCHNQQLFSAIFNFIDLFVHYYKTGNKIIEIEQNIVIKCILIRPAVI